MKKILMVLGALNASLLMARAVLSYFLVTVVPFGSEESNERAFFGSLAESLAFFGSGFQDLLTGNSLFRSEAYFAAAAVTPVLLSSLIFIVLLILISRYRDEISDAVPGLLFRWSVVFVCIGAVAIPMFAQDFWLSIGWGRMVAAGSNPYHADLTLEFAKNLPLDYFGGRMTYGPLWALISGAIAFIAGGNVLVEAVLFKLLIASALIGSIYLIWKLLEGYSLFHQCLGLVIAGWMPVAMTEIAGDGHNDIVMVFLLLLWLYFLRRGEVMAATLALAASALVKYVTAPLFLLEILYVYFSLRRPFRTFFAPLLAAAGLMLFVFGIFYRSPDFFSAASAMRDWHFFTPRDAVASVSGLMGVSRRLQYIPQAIFVLFALYGIFRYVKERTNDAFHLSVLAVLSAILYTALGHIWPWFMLWVLPLSALVPGSALSRWNIGVALAFPFALIALQFTDRSGFWRWDVPGICVFAFALLWLAASTQWRPVSEAASRPSNEPAAGLT